MGLFDRDEKKKKADFSNVDSESSSTAPETRESAASQSYTVKGGDTLWAISERFYGDGSQWPRIHEANRDLIEDPDVIQPGWDLAIPPADEDETPGGDA